MSRVAENVAERLEDHINSMLDLTAGHDTVHPDRSVCGGVGACLTMRAEVDAEQELERLFRHAAKHGVRVAIGVKS